MLVCQIGESVNSPPSSVVRPATFGGKDAVNVSYLVFR